MHKKTNSSRLASTQQTENRRRKCGKTIVENDIQWTSRSKREREMRKNGRKKNRERKTLMNCTGIPCDNVEPKIEHNKKTQRHNTHIERR